MNNLYAAWGIVFLIGMGLLAIDVVFLPLFEVRGVPAFSLVGGALLLLVFTSILNWIFKTAWNERINPGSPEN